MNISIDRRDVSSEEEEPTEKEGDNPFDQAIQGVLFRRITIKNLSADSLLMVATLPQHDVCFIIMATTTTYHCH